MKRTLPLKCSHGLSLIRKAQSRTFGRQGYRRTETVEELYYQKVFGENSQIHPKSTFL